MFRFRWNKHVLILSLMSLFIGRKNRNNFYSLFINVYIIIKQNSKRELIIKFRDDFIITN